MVQQFFLRRVNRLGCCLFLFSSVENTRQSLVVGQLRMHNQRHPQLADMDCQSRGIAIQDENLKTISIFQISLQNLERLCLLSGVYEGIIFRILLGYFRVVPYEFAIVARKTQKTFNLILSPSCKILNIFAMVFKCSCNDVLNIKTSSRQTTQFLFMNSLRMSLMSLWNIAGAFLRSKGIQMN